MRLRDVMQRLYRTYQRIDIDLPADCRPAVGEFRDHCLSDTRSHYLIILEFDVPRILEAIAPYGLGMYCQDLAETTNAKLKDFYLRFTNGGGSTTDDYQLSALLQTMEHAFLYTHSHIVAQGATRPISCPNAPLFEFNRRCRSMVLTKEDKADVARLVAVCVILQALQACVVVLRI